MRLGVAAAMVDGRLVAGDVEISEGLIAEVGLASPAGKGLAVPGLVDLQVNGFGGVDLLGADSEGYRRVGEALLETGVTSYLPTLITAPENLLLSALREVPVESDGPHILGVHLEGPFLSPLRLGVHPADDRRDPDILYLERLLAAGPIRMVTLAPELPGAHELIEHLARRGVPVSLGHTDATAEQADMAFELGARAVTHVFNAMRPFHHRDPGVAGAALARDDVVVQLILDGIHVVPTTAQLVWRAAAGRVALVTDAMAGAGLGDGAYALGALEVDVRNGVARAPTGQLAGSTLTLIEAVRSLHRLGATLESAVGAATEVPARVLGHPSAGRLAPGLPADVVILNDELVVERVLIGGVTQVAR